MPMADAAARSDKYCRCIAVGTEMTGGQSGHVPMVPGNTTTLQY